MDPKTRTLVLDTTLTKQPITKLNSFHLLGLFLSRREVIHFSAKTPLVVPVSITNIVILVTTSTICKLGTGVILKYQLLLVQESIIMSKLIVRLSTVTLEQISKANQDVLNLLLILLTDQDTMMNTENLMMVFAQCLLVSDGKRIFKLQQGLESTNTSVLISIPNIATLPLILRSRKVVKKERLILTTDLVLTRLTTILVMA